MIRPSPNELDRLRKDEFQRRRIQRLKEVRLFSKDHASKLRDTYKDQKRKVIEKIAGSIQEQLCKVEAAQINELKNKLKYQTEHVGCAHKDANNRPNIVEENEKRTLESNIKANQRNKEAIRHMLLLNKQKEMEQCQKLEGKNYAMLIEKERAAAISALPPQNQEYEIMMNTDADDGKPRVKVCDKTKYSLIESTKPADYTVEKRGDNIFSEYGFQRNQNQYTEIDAMEAGEIRQQQLQKQQQTQKIEMVEYDLKAHLRGNQALKKQLVKKDYNELVDNLEQISKSEMMKRQKDYFKHEILSSAAGGNASLIHNQAMKQFKERCRERAVENVVIDSLRDVTNQHTSHQSRGFNTIEEQDDHEEENDEESASEMAKLYSLIKKQKQQKRGLQNFPDSNEENDHQEQTIEEPTDFEMSKQERSIVGLQNSKVQQESNPSYCVNLEDDVEIEHDLNSLKVPRDLAKERERLEKDVEEIELKIQQILASKANRNISESMVQDDDQKYSFSNPFNDTITVSVDPAEYQERIHQFQQDALGKMCGKLDRSDLVAIQKCLSNNSLNSTSQSSDSWEPRHIEQSMSGNFNIPPLPAWISTDTSQVNMMDYMKQITKSLSVSSSSSLSSTIHTIPSSMTSSSSSVTAINRPLKNNDRNMLDKSELSNADVSNQSNEDIAQISNTTSSSTSYDRCDLVKSISKLSSTVSTQGSCMDCVSYSEDITKITMATSNMKENSCFKMKTDEIEIDKCEDDTAVDLDSTLVPYEDDVDDVHDNTMDVNSTSKESEACPQEIELCSSSTPTFNSKSSMINDYEQFLASLSQKLSVNIATPTSISDSSTQQTLIDDNNVETRSALNTDTDDDDIIGQTELFDKVEDFLKKCHSETKTDSNSFMDLEKFTFPQIQVPAHQYVTSTMKPDSDLISQPLWFSDMSSIKSKEDNEHNLETQRKHQILQEYLFKNNSRIQELLGSQNKDTSLHTLPTITKIDSDDNDDDENTIHHTDSGKPSSRNHSNGDETNRTIPTQELVSLSSEFDHNGHDNNGINTSRTNNTDGYFTDFGDNDIFNTFQTLPEYVSKDDSGETKTPNCTNSTTITNNEELMENSTKSIDNIQAAESIDLMVFNSNNDLAHSIHAVDSADGYVGNHESNTSTNVAFGSSRVESNFLLDQSIGVSNQSLNSENTGSNNNSCYHINNNTDCNRELREPQIPSADSSNELLESMVYLPSVKQSKSSRNSSSHMNVELLSQNQTGNVDQDTEQFQSQESHNFLSNIFPDKSSADISSQSLASFMQNEALCEEETEFLFGTHSASANNITSAFSENESQQSSHVKTRSQKDGTIKTGRSSRLENNTEEMKNQLQQWKQERLMRVTTCPPAATAGLYKGLQSVTKTSKDRKNDVSEFKRRTEKLWNRCEEVQKYKKQKEYEQQRQQNQNKKKEYAEKLRQKQKERQQKCSNNK